MITARGSALCGLVFVLGTILGLGVSMVAPTTAADRTPAAPPEAEAVVVVPDAPEEPACEPGPLDARAAQLVVVGLPDVVSADDPLVAELVDLGVGGVFLNDGNVVDTVQVQALTATLRASFDLPVLITTDEEAGRVSTFRHLIGATSSPRTLAATRSSEDVRTYAMELGQRLAELGLNSDLAPVADLDAGPAAGVIGDRSFSADPLLAAEHAAAFASGLADAGIIPVAKHFPGLGRADDDVHRSAAAIDAPLEELLATDIMPFVGLIEAGVPIVMTGHAVYDALDPEQPASLSPSVYALLRELGFKGVAMTDSIGMGAIHRRWDFPEATVAAVEAGADAVLATDGRQATDMVAALVRAVERGRLDESRLDEAAARMLALKGIDPAVLTCVTTDEVPVVAAPALASQ